MKLERKRAGCVVTLARNIQMQLAQYFCLSCTKPLANAHGSSQPYLNSSDSSVGLAEMYNGSWVLEVAYTHSVLIFNNSSKDCCLSYMTPYILFPLVKVNRRPCQEIWGCMLITATISLCWHISLLVQSYIFSLSLYVMYYERKDTQKISSENPAVKGYIHLKSLWDFTNYLKKSFAEKIVLGMDTLFIYVAENGAQAVVIHDKRNSVSE